MKFNWDLLKTKEFFTLEGLIQDYSDIEDKKRIKPHNIFKKIKFTFRIKDLHGITAGNVESKKKLL